MKPEDDERRRRVATLGLASMALGVIARSGEPPGSRPTSHPSRVAICFDQGRPLRRQAIYPGYQATRFVDAKFTSNEPHVLFAIEAFREAAAMLPVDVLSSPDTEADDLVAGLVHEAHGAPVRIVSTDRDFLQLVGPTTSIYAPVKKLVIDASNFFDVAVPKTPSGEPVVFPIERFLDYRVLVGDPSDNIPGVPGFGAMSAARLMAAGALDAYLADPSRLREALGRRSDAIERAFADGTAAMIIDRNRSLMSLRAPAPCWNELPALTRRGTWDAAAFSSWLDAARITSVERPALMHRLEALAELRASS
jgi:DNA polymerase-1